MNLKFGLSQLQNHLEELETAARKLDNQNFADLIKSARGRLSQAEEHPDVDAVGELLRKDLDGGQERLPFEPGKGDFKEPAFDPAGTSKPFVPGDNPDQDGK